MSESSDDRPRRRRRRRRGRRAARPGAPSAQASGQDVAEAPVSTNAARSAAGTAPDAVSSDPRDAKEQTRSAARRRRGRRGNRNRRREVTSPDATVSASDGPTPSIDVHAPHSTASAAHASAAANGTANGSVPATPSANSARRDRAELETSAGGIVYRMQNGEALFLLIRDSYRNWGFPKGHLEAGEQPQEAALREVQEETGLAELRVDGAIETIDWFFRFRGKLVHKVCHFYLMRTRHARTTPQREEGITACRWAKYDDATRLISYANARAVLMRAHEMVIADGATRG